MEQPNLVDLPVANEIQPPLVGAGFLVRAGARIIDTIVHNVIGLVSGVFVGIAVGVYIAIMRVPSEQLIKKIGAASILDFVFALIAYVLYSAISEYIYGASLGKLIFKIHVVNKNGGPISIKAALIRSLAYFVDGLFFGAVAYQSMTKSRLNQRVGDEWANTAVVQRSTLAPIQLPAWWKFVLAFFIAALVDSFVVSVAAFLKLL